MKRNYILFLKDIKNAIQSIFTFIEDMTYEEFKENDLVQSGVIRKIEIMGEAAKNIPAHIKEKYPGVPWTEMSRTRDKFIHGYFTLDNRIIWNLVEQRLQEIPGLIDDILTNETEKKGGPC